MQNPAIMAQNIGANITQSVRKIQSTQREYYDGAHRIYDEINPTFQQVFGVPLEQALTTIPSLNLQKKKRAQQKKKRKKKTIKTGEEQHRGTLKKYISN